MPFFTFDQNNSGGSFDIWPKAGIACYVIIEADDANDANDRAESAGLYFNGCENGTDCPCCGDRWYHQYDNTDGTDEPTVFGRSIKDFLKDPNTTRWTKKKGGMVAVHYKNGTIKTYS